MAGGSKMEVAGVRLLLLPSLACYARSAIAQSLASFFPHVLSSALCRFREGPGARGSGALRPLRLFPPPPIEAYQIPRIHLAAPFPPSPWLVKRPVACREQSFKRTLFFFFAAHVARPSLFGFGPATWCLFKVGLILRPAQVASSGI